MVLELQHIRFSFGFGDYLPKTTVLDMTQESLPVVRETVIHRGGRLLEFKRDAPVGGILIVGTSLGGSTRFSNRHRVLEISTFMV